MCELEDELMKPTGVLIVKRPPLHSDLATISPDCGVLAEDNNTDGIWSHIIFRKVTSCALILEFPTSCELSAHRWWLCGASLSWTALVAVTSDVGEQDPSFSLKNFMLVCYIFIGLRTITTSFCPIFPYCDLLPLIIRRLHRTASFLSLIHYHPNLQLTLVLSSGALLILLLVAVLLSCTIQRSTKWCYYTFGLCPLAPVALPTQSRLRVYKLYQCST